MGETFQIAPLFAASCPALPGSVADWQRYHFADVADMQTMIGTRAGAWNDDVWTSGDAGFYGTPDMESALALARDGWAEGAAAAREAWAGIEAAMPQVRRGVTHGFTGSSVNVARMLAGHPKHMRRRTLADAPVRPIITLIANASAPSNVSAADMLAHAIAQAAVVDMLEARGYRCDLLYVKRAVNNAFGYEIAIRGKAPDQPRNLAALTFLLGHPAAYRRLGFAMVQSRPECKPIGSVLGRPLPVEQKEARPGTFILPAQQICEEGSTAVERFRALLRRLGKAGCPGIPAEAAKAA